MLKITSKNNSKILGIGEHLVTIIMLVLATAKASDLYKDVTEQIAVTFQDGAGKTIIRWFNLKGYELDADNPVREDDAGREVPNYAVGKNGNRIESKKNTEAAQNILAQLGYHAGIEEGEEFDVADLEGLKVGIMVEKDDRFGKLKVAYSLPASEVGAEAETVFQGE